MNRNFKVVFSKARGALMVVNEATASVQAKGTKTVIAAAIAAVAGVASASAYVEAPTTEGDNVAIFNTTTTADKLKAETSFVLKTDTKTPLLSLAADTTLTGKLWVTGDHANARASGVWLANKDATVTNEGTIYVTSTSNGKSWQNRAMGVDKGTLVNNGTIVAKDAYGLTVGSSGGDDTAKIINGVNGKIIVEDRGVGIELGGIGSSTQTKAEATNYGTISVGAAKEFEDKATKGQFAIGVQIKGDTGTDKDTNATTYYKIGDQTFTNEGTIDAAADGAKAVYVEIADGAAVTNNGTIKGLVHVDAHAENTKLTFGEKSVLTGDINVDGTNTEIGFAQDAVTTGNLVNTGTGTKIQAAADKKVATLTGDLLVKKGDVTQSGNLKANNLVVGVADATANGQTVTGTSGAYTVKGTLGVKSVSLVKGSVTVDGTNAALTADEVSVVKGTSVVLSNKGAATAGKLTVAKEGTVTVGKDSVFTVTGEGANAGTIAGAQEQNKDASVGTLTVAGALANTGTISTDVEVSGTLNNQVVSGETKTNGKLNGAKLTIAKGGVVNTLVTEKTYAVQNTVVEAGGVLNVLELNSKSNDELKANDRMLLAGATLTLDGGAIQVAGKDYTDGVLKLGTKDVGGSLVVKSGDYTAKSVEFGSSKQAALEVNGGSYTIGTLDATNAQTVKVGADGKLVVNDKLTTVKPAGQDAAVQVEGSLSAKLAALGYSVGTDGKLAAVTTGATAAAGSINVANGGVFNITELGADKLTKTDVETLKGLTTGNGLVDLGKVTISDLTITDNTIKASDLIAGVATDALDKVTVTEVSGTGLGSSGSYGALQLAADANGVTQVAANTTLTLNNEGALVTYTKGTGKDAKQEAAKVELQKGASLVTTGAKATLGAVTQASGAAAGLTVASGDLTVQDLDTKHVTTNVLVDVGTLTVAKGAAFTAGLTVAAKAATVTEKAVEAQYGDVKADKLVVDGKFNAANSKVTLANGGSVAGEATIKDLTVAATKQLNVTGKADITTLSGSVNVGAKDQTGSLGVGTLSSGTIFADPSWESGLEAAKVAVKTLAAGASVQAGRNSVVALGTADYDAAFSAVKATGFNVADASAKGASFKDVNSVVYVTTGAPTTDKVTGVVSYAKVEGNVLADDADTVATSNTNVTVSGGSLLVLDAQALDTTGKNAVFAKSVTLEKGAKIFVDGAKNGQKILLSAATGTAASLDGDNVYFDGDLVMSGKVDQGTVSVAIDDRSDFATVGLDAAGFDVVYSMYEQGENVGNESARFFRDLFTRTTSSAYGKLESGEYEWNVATLNTVLNDVAAIGATTGAQAVTMDAVNQMADTVAARTSVLAQRGQGVNVWVDVNGGSFEGKEVMNGAGYTSDIYSGVLGVDYQFTNGAILGAALTVGTADTDSENTTAKTSMDTDLVGFSVYGSKTFDGIWNVAGDVGYLQASNDVTESGYGFGKFSEDVDAWTVGVRGEVLTKAGPVNVVPHVGLRWTRLSTDGFTAGFNTEVDDQNVFQLPVGVTVAADFQTNGWTVAPKFDLSVVPTFGDKDAELKLGITGVTASDDLSVRVIDSNPVQATLGVNATNGAWGFGLNYKLGVGSDDRMNNTFNANVRYAF